METKLVGPADDGSGNESNFSSEKQINAIGFTGDISQAKHIGYLLDQISDRNETTAVVLGDENLLLPTLQSFSERITDWNVTMGHPIDRLPITQFIIDYFELFIFLEEEEFVVSKILKLVRFEAYQLLFEKSKKDKI